MENFAKCTVAAIILASLLTSCGSTRIKHLEPDEFLKRAAQIEMPNSASAMEYVGCTHGRAYLEYFTAVTFFGMNAPHTIYWTELDGLPADISAKLKAGDSPWVPWYAKPIEDGQLNLEVNSPALFGGAQSETNAWRLQE